MLPSLLLASLVLAWDDRCDRGCQEKLAEMGSPQKDNICGSGCKRMLDQYPAWKAAQQQAQRQAAAQQEVHRQAAAQQEAHRQAALRGLAAIQEAQRQAAAQQEAQRQAAAQKSQQPTLQSAQQPAAQNAQNAAAVSAPPQVAPQKEGSAAASALPASSVGNTKSGEEHSLRGSKTSWNLPDAANGAISVGAHFLLALFIT